MTTVTQKETTAVQQQKEQKNVRQEYKRNCETRTQYRNRRHKCETKRQNPETEEKSDEVIVTQKL